MSPPAYAGALKKDDGLFFFFFVYLSQYVTATLMCIRPTSRYSYCQVEEAAQPGCHRTVVRIPISKRKLQQNKKESCKPRTRVECSLENLVRGAKKEIKRKRYFFEQDEFEKGSVPSG